MGINDETDEIGSLQIGPTSAGMVRIYVSGTGIDLPMDFTPDEAEEIANEILDAIRRAREQSGQGSGNDGAKGTKGKPARPNSNPRRR